VLADGGRLLFLVEPRTVTMMNASLLALTNHILHRLRDVIQQMGIPVASVNHETCFGDVLDSMGMVEFLAILADDCGATPPAIEACVNRRFGSVQQLAAAMHAAGIVPQIGAARLAVAAPAVRAAGLGTWLAATAVRLPDTLQSAADMNAKLARPPGWLESHAGIRQRRVWNNQDPIAAAADAGRQCLRTAGIAASDVGALLVTSEAPPLLLGLAAAIHDRLHLRSSTIALETGGACTGFLSALWTAQAILPRTGTVLIVSIEAHSRHLLLQPGPAGEGAALFGDAAAAVLACANPVDDGAVRLEDVMLRVDGGGGRLLQVEPSAGGAVELRMNGITLAGRAVDAMGQSVMDLLERHDRKLADVAAIVAHGGNGRLPGLLARRLGIAPEKIWSETPNAGNLGSASLPVAWTLHEPKPKGLVIWTAVGAGLMWGAAMMGE
jgi:3-oxoacyl-[acyl-carrier-protein] synthase-3